MLKDLITWPVRIVGHVAAKLAFPDDLHFLLCDCPTGGPQSWIPSCDTIPK